MALRASSAYFGADHAQFVGLPDEVDVLGEAEVLAAPVGVDDGGLQECGDAAELVEDGAPGGLGRVCGEDGPYVEVLDGLAQVVGVGVLEPVGRPGEEPSSAARRSRISWARWTCSVTLARWK